MSKKLSTQEKARRMWVRALRSGKYHWGKEQLHPTDDKHCCLGVLCEVAIKQGVITSYNPHTSYLPTAVKKWVGLNSTNRDFYAPRYRIDTLAELNDESKRNPFKQIARMIENKSPGLFEEEAS